MIHILHISDIHPGTEQDAETYRPTAALFYWPLGMAWIVFTFLIVCDWRGWGDD